MTDIIVLIDAEIAQLRSARALLAGAAGAIVKRGPGRPQDTGKKKRKMSPEGRARLIAAVKARWARQRKAGK